MRHRDGSCGLDVPAGLAEHHVRRARIEAVGPDKEVDEAVARVGGVTVIATQSLGLVPRGPDCPSVIATATLVEPLKLSGESKVTEANAAFKTAAVSLIV